MTELVWRKSSRSGTQGNDCVEVAQFADGTAVRDSKDPDSGRLGVSPSQWRGFLAHVKAGLFDC